ncbi:MAG: PAS domain-containing protein, partial [Calditrichaeota bacterium]|nr:PAS domain-containing protein [Calditrichota bacterium]
MTYKRRFITGILIILVVPLSSVILGTLGFWLQLGPDDKTFLFTLIDHNRIYIFLSFLIFTGILGYIAKWMLFQYFIPLQKLAEDAGILKSAERLYTIETKGAKELKQLAVILSRHAYEIKELRENINEKIRQAKNDLEEEKNILTSLVSELNDAIIICNNDGKIVLFNHHAYQLCDDPDADDFQNRIGIGRSFFKIIPSEIIRHALEEIDHKFRQGQQNAYTQLVYPLPSRVSARIRIIPVSKGKEKIGFIVIMHDITAELDKDLKRHEMVESLIDTTRSSVAGIRAAIESIISYNEMQEEQRVRFNNVILEEAKRLGAFVNETIANYKDYFKLNWPMEQIEGQSLLNLLHLYSKTISDLKLEVKDPENGIWVSVENFSFIITVLYLLRQISTIAQNTISLELNNENNFMYLDILWKDGILNHDQFNQILANPVDLNNVELPFSANDVIQRHNARIWLNLSENNLHSIRIMLRAADAVTESVKKKQIIYGARPEFYDFDLF